MNNRDYKQFFQGQFTHIYNRGNGKMDIFRDTQDFQNFLKRIRLVLGVSKMPFDTKSRIRITPLPKNSLFIICYELMSNHFHFIMFQNSSITPDKFIHKLSTSYAKYYSKKYGHVGNLFQDQFKAVPITSNAQLLWLSAYIRNNPVKAGLVKKISEYPWSSYHEYKYNFVDICNKQFLLEQFGSTQNFLKNTLEDFDDDINNELKLE